MVSLVYVLQLEKKKKFCVDVIKVSPLDVLRKICKKKKWFPPPICLTIAVNFYDADLDMIMLVDMSVRWVAGQGMLTKGLMVVMQDDYLVPILQVNAV